MKTQALRFLPALLLCSALANSAFAASNYFLEIDGIPGESKDVGHPNTIAVDTFSFGASNSGPVGTGGGGGGAGRVSFSEISFKKTIDKTSPLLYLNTANGRPIRTAVLFVRKSGGTTGRPPADFYTITLSDVRVSSVQTSGGNGDVPVESFSLTYGKIEFSYSAQKPDGSLDTPIKSGWDLVNNRAL